MKFIIVGLPKTGKTMLCDCLDSLNGFFVYDEIFASRMGVNKIPDHPLKLINDMRKRKERNSFVKWYQKTYNNNLTDILRIANNSDVDEFLDYTFVKNENVGFKLHHHHIQDFPYILDYIKKNNIKVIHTDREDKVKQAIAIIGNRNRITFTKKKITVKPEAVKKCIDDLNWRTEELNKWFPNALKITYEQMTNDQHITELDVTVVRDYLKVDMPDVIKVRTVKNTFSELKDNVTNHGELNELSTN